MVVSLIGIVLASILIFVIILLIQPMKIPREPEREGEQKGDAVQAYDRASGGPVFSLERALVTHELNKLCPEGLLLDIGCGPGYLAAHINRKYPSLKIVGLDINHEMLNLAIQHWYVDPYNIIFIMADAQTIPIESNSIDFIMSSLSLHHWPDAEMVFKEMNRILKPGGQFVVFDLRRDGLTGFYYVLKLGQLFALEALRRTNGAVGSFWSSYTLSEIDIMMVHSGFNLRQIQPYPGWMVIRGQKSSEFKL